jgi:hypothetical protein
MANAQQRTPQTPCYIPRGRIVQGSLTELQTTDPKGKPLDKPRKFFAVAVPKNDPKVNDAIGIAYQVAATGYASMPQVSQHLLDANRNINLATQQFAWKIEDGDAPENRGKEGFAGCWVFKFQTTLLDRPLCGDVNGQQIDPLTVKRGYFVDVYASVSINNNTDHTAGIYFNPTGLRLLDVGPEIHSGPTFTQMFGDKPAVTSGQAMPAAAPAGVPGVGMPAAAPVGNPGVAGPGVQAGVPSMAAPAAMPGMPSPGAPAMSAQPAPATASLSNPPAGVVPNQQFGHGIPAGTAPAPSPAPAPQPQPAGPTAAQIAAQYGQAHHPGWRYDPVGNKYDPDPTSV